MTTLLRADIVDFSGTASAKALAANRLSDGISVWATRSGNGFVWTERWDEVLPVPAEDADTLASLEAFAASQVQASEVVSERLIDVAAEGDGSFTPTRLRERVVANGPTIRTDLGKQAEVQDQRRAA